MPLWRTWTLDWIVQLALWIFCEKLFTLSVHEEASLLCPWCSPAWQISSCLKFYMPATVFFVRWISVVDACEVCERICNASGARWRVKFGLFMPVWIACMAVFYSYLIRWNLTVCWSCVRHACVACKYLQYTPVGSLFVVRFYLGNVMVCLEKKSDTLIICAACLELFVTA